MKKGFTLLEMLAVIVVMSILSLIILPNITGQLADKKEEISKVSQKIILSAAELYANENNISSKTITIEDLVKDGKLDEPVKDQKTGKNISLSKEISIDSNGNTCLVGIDGCTKTYSNGEAVYFNPVTAKQCKKSESTSKTETTTGCMKWYAFNDSSSSEKVNLLLDHNTTALVKWDTESNWLETNKTFMNDAKKAFDKDIAEWDSEIKSTARLMTANEVTQITGYKDWNNISSQNMYYLETNSDKIPEAYSGKYGWMYDNIYGCKKYGCNVEDNNKIYNEELYTTKYGQSTNAPVINYYLSTQYMGSPYVISLEYDEPPRLTIAHPLEHGNGIRPVITVSKSKLS